MASGLLEILFFLSCFHKARITFDISCLRSLGQSDSESELDELELLPLGGGTRGGITPPGGLLSLYPLDLC